MAYKPAAFTSTTTAQVRAAYDATNYTDITTGSGGDLTIAPTGGDTSITGTLAVSTTSVLTGVVTATAGVVGNLTGNASGSSGSTTGNAATATALATARTINAVSFDGTGNIVVTAAAGTLTGATLASGVTASSLVSLGIITSGQWRGTPVAAAYLGSHTHVIGDVTGLQTALDAKFAAAGGTVTGDVTVTGNLTVEGTTTTLNVDTLSIEDPVIELARNNTGLSSYIGVKAERGGTDAFWVWVEATDRWTAYTSTDDLATVQTLSSIEAAGVHATTFTGALTGNVTGNITGTAPAGTLTGATLASGVTASSLTSLGTIASLVATTADINGGTFDGIVGGTTPADGSFTTLSASSTVSAAGTITSDATGGGILRVQRASGNRFYIQGDTNALSIVSQDSGTATWDITGFASGTIAGTLSVTGASTLTGNIGVGRAPTNAAIVISHSFENSAAISLGQSASSPYGILLDFSAAAQNNRTNYFLKMEDSSAVKSTLWSDGGATFTGLVAGTSATLSSTLAVTGAATFNSLTTLSYGDYQNSGALSLGADIGALASRTNATEKFGVITVPNYTNAEEPVWLMGVYTRAATNVMYIGGSTGINCATSMLFYTANNSSTVTGTLGLTITGGTSPASTFGGTLAVTGGIVGGAFSIGSLVSGYDQSIDKNGAGAPIGAFIRNTGTATGDDVRLVFETQGSRTYRIGIDRSSGLFELGSGFSAGTTAGVTMDTSGNVAIPTTLSVTGTSSFASNSAWASTARLYLDGVSGTGDTYIYESAANTVKVFAGGAEALAIKAGQIEIAPTNKFYLDGGGDTYIYESAANTITTFVGASKRVETTATIPLAVFHTGVDATPKISWQATYSSNDTENNAVLTSVGGAENAGFYFEASDGGGAATRTLALRINRDGLRIPATNKLWLDGGGDTFIQEDSANRIFMSAGGNAMLLTAAAATIYGNLSVLGSLSKGSGSFKIDHPLPAKKDTHHLVHSFIEGPRADLIYRGVAALSKGSASVDLDAAADMTSGTWELLCRDPQVWIQNDSGWAQVRGSVAGSTLTIACEDAASTDSVSWMVVAERCDPHIIETDWTDAEGRVIVEPEKTEAATAAEATA
jgi:hypothetical protein